MLIGQRPPCYPVEIRGKLLVRIRQSERLGMDFCGAVEAMCNDVVPLLSLKCPFRA